MRITDRLPEWMRSIRFRLTVLYSAVLLGIAVLLVGGLYLGLSLRLRHEPLAREVAVTGVFRAPDGTLHPMRAVIIPDVRAFESAVNQRTLDQLRTFSLSALGVLFVVSLGVGWVIAGRVLAPIGAITDVARRIQATDLSRRIQLSGPKDELRDLADTFDAMLDRLAGSFRAQRRFVADASHELRNPLAIIQTNLDVALADDAASAEERSRATDAIQRATQRMSRLVDDLLVLARHEAPQAPRTPTNVCVLIADVADDFAGPAGERGIELHRTCSPAEVEADVEGLKRALANLVDNAVRLAPENSVVQLAGGTDGEWAWLSVTDEGPGIPPDQQASVFERFWRADDARSRSEGGSGLGLAIVKEVVESHGGRARVHSDAGAGSTFVLWLPTSASATPGEPPDRRPAEPGL